ncbi:MAG: VWA domain-containing protein [Alphaproteobacteria bacterium]
MRSIFLSIIIAFSPLLLPAASAHAGVKVKAELAHNVLPEAQEGRVYMRVRLEGLPFEDETDRPPVNVVLVIDKSGSMRGARIEQARDAAMMAVDSLEEKDVLGVVAYSHEVEVLAPAGHLGDAKGINDHILHLRANGRTALYAGVKEGLRQLREFSDPNAINRIVLLSDGMANVGPSTPAELEELGREAAKDGISVTTIGLGLGYNEDLMTRLALASDGNHAFVESPGDLVRIFNKEFGDVLSAVGGDVDVEIECPDGFYPMRALGREAKIDGQRIKFKLNQIYGRQEKYLVVELKINKDHAKGEGEAAKVQVNYTDLKSKKRATVNSQAKVRFSASKQEQKAGVNKEVVAEVTTQIANERNERALSLRDKGKEKEARAMLQENAKYLKRQADKLPAPSAEALNKMSKKNLEDAEKLSGADWRKQRKIMRARQYKSKTQQSY